MPQNAGFVHESVPMLSIPRLQTQRLILRPFVSGDGSRVEELAGAREVAGEIGYWISVSWWGKGNATEAARAITDFGFDALDLHRIQGRHFTRNVASGRVRQKLGMRLEGIHRDAFLRWDRFEDVAVYAILRSERDGVAAPAAG